MSAFAGAARRGTPLAVLIGGILLLALAAVSGHGAKQLGPLVAVLAIFTVWQRSILRWHSLVALILLVVLFVPIGRYKLPGSLPFNLELYRVVVALVVTIWLASLLIDRRVRLRRTPFDAPLLLLAACIIVSEIVNPNRVNPYSSFVAKTLTFYLSFWLVYYVTATTIRSRDSVSFLLKLLAFGGSLIGLFAVIEQRTGFNIFDHLHSVLPILTFDPLFTDTLRRGGNLRVLGPSEHPIALGAMLIMILPLTVYFARTSTRRWWFGAALIVLGSLASGSRTAITMLVAEIVIFLRLKPKETKRLWPLCVPAIVVVHAFLPGAIGTFRAAFFPKGGIIAEQSQLASNENAQLAGGRIRQLRPMIAEAGHHPLFGEGLGTRITGFDVPLAIRNAPILDNQWLNNLLDVGYVGLFLWLWLFVRAIRRLMRESRNARDDDDAWLFAGLAAAMTAFPIGMLTFDAYGFTQVFFVFWILLGLSAAMLMIVSRERQSTRAHSSGARSRPGQ
jgi:O-antigen ligase